MPRKNPPSRPLRRTPVRGAVVLITGGASGIGRLMGLEAARRRAGAVVVWDLDASGARRVVEEVRRLGGRKDLKSLSNSILLSFLSHQPVQQTFFL